MRALLKQASRAFFVATLSSPSALAALPAAPGASTLATAAPLSASSPPAAVPTTSASVQAPAAPDAGLAAYVERLRDEARAKGLAKEPQWLKLGHYRASKLGGYKSEADGPAFFLSKKGPSDPEAELLATIDAFHARPLGGHDGHALCTFPARFAYLARALSLDVTRLPNVGCEKFEKYWTKVDADAVSVVFSGYYLNNPASAFGHTFLRLHRRNQAGATTERLELLDYGVDYAAEVPDGENAAVYAVKGLTGIYHGGFKLLPYFYKVREYNDLESRDLWTYELALPPEKLTLLVAHLWELGSTYFDYWYMSENCSYHILAAIEVAEPTLSLLDRVRWPVVPIDTVKALLANKGLVKRVHHRPALRSVLEARTKTMSGAELDAVDALVSDPQAVLPTSWAPERKAAVLDAAADLVDVRYSRKIVEDAGSAPAVVKQKLLQRRAELAVVSDEVEVPTDPRTIPERGHGSSRIMLGYGRTVPAHGAAFAAASRPFLQLDFRLTLHDLADAPRGYPEGSQIEFLPTRVRLYGAPRSFQLEDFALVRVLSLMPWTRFQKALSWRVRAGVTRLHDPGCDGCVFPVAELGFGATLGAFHDALMVFALGDTRAYLGRLASNSQGAGPIGRASVGPQLGMRARLSDAFVWLTTGGLQVQPWQTPRTTWSAQSTLRWMFARDWAFDLEARAFPTQRDVRLAMTAYF